MAVEVVSTVTVEITDEQAPILPAVAPTGRRRPVRAAERPAGTRVVDGDETVQQVEAEQVRAVVTVEVALQDPPVLRTVAPASVAHTVGLGERTRRFGDVARHLTAQDVPAHEIVPAVTIEIAELRRVAEARPVNPVG